MLIAWPHSSTGTAYWTIPTHRGRGKRNSGASRDPDDQDAQFKIAFYEALDDPEVASKLARIISKANRDLVEHISSLRQEVRSLRSSLQERDATIVELRREVKLLHDDLNALEQHGRCHSPCISGISMREEDTIAAVDKLTNKVPEIAPPLSTKDINVSHRLQKPRNDRADEPAPRILHFVSGFDRDRVIREGKSSKDVNTDETTKVYINEDLTTRRAKIFSMA